MTIHHHMRAHARYLRSRATPTRCIVTIGVIITTTLLLFGKEHAALAVSIATNLVWIWETE